MYLIEQKKLIVCKWILCHVRCVYCLCRMSLANVLPILYLSIIC